MTIRARFLAAVTLAGVAALPRVAGAADCSPASRLSTCIDSDNLWPKAGPSLFTSVGGATITPPGQMSFGLVTSFQKRPLSLRLPSADPAGTVVPLVDNQFDATFLWSVGLGSRFELTVAAPVTLFQDGFGLSAVTDQKPTELVRTAIRDPRLGLTYALVPRPVTTADGLAVAVRTDVTLPTGDRDVYASGGSFVGIPAIAAEWRSGRLAIAAEAGARLRSTHELAGTRIGSQLVESVGASWDVRPNELLAVTAEVFSLQTLASQSTTTRDATGALVDGPSRAMNAPTEWLAGLRSAPALAGDVTLHAAFGTSIPLSDNDATQPRYRFVGGVRYAPLGRDRDGDGILDRDDKCPDQPEDRDGFEDEDGCPDPDNDRDGIPDSQDKCRDAAEDFDGFQDEDGDGILDGDDKCRSEAEDKDGFQDEDGCPDPDNDQDGILDKADMCPNGPEDVDGFKDEDGCPDPDNDLDGIPDKQDKCPNEPEDKDGFEDDDGCPDPDNDQDGILDKNDKCPNEAETINGIDDEDGCPEPNAKDQTKVVGDRVLVEPPLRFARGSAKLAPDAVKGLAMSAQRARGIRDVERVVVEVYGDAGSPAAQQEKLAGQRADAVKTALEGAGLPGLVVVAGDPGEKRKADAPHVSFQVVVKKRKAPR
jgi:outer membrane protein OmpA-like peptidoglycan-associated protein